MPVAQLWFVISLGTLLAAAAWSSSLPGEEWPHWRGPARNGIAPAADLRVDWGESGPPVVWRGQVGTGFSSLAIAEGRLFTLGNAEETQTLWCLDAETGTVLWKYSSPEPLDPNLFEGGPTATPSVSDDAVFTFSRRGVALCCEAATGTVRWQVDVPARCGVNIPTWGFASSPVVVDDRVLLGAGRHGVALDRRTGEVLWQSDNEEDAAYATPVLAEWGGIPTALVLSAKSLHAVDLRSGALRWEHRWVTRYGVNAADPLIAGEAVWLSSGYAKGSALLRVAEDGTAAVEMFRTRELRNQMAPGVLIDGHVYAVDGDAGDACALKCLELTSGQVRWSEEGLGMATVMAVGDRLVVLTESGELLLAAATPQGFSPQARAAVLEGKCWTPPAFANGRLYCRNAAGEVVCLDLRP